ncbi:MAG: YiiX family permuted papain-like enzyme [Bacteroidota bacterium]|nr:YiiX family permuted papain-like enzyme [Bacteroidota bacterium]MDP3144778.1 YiiX family permuted papain-like enzyme [Bacteroidota bacterium]
MRKIILFSGLLISLLLLSSSLIPKNKGKNLHKNGDIIFIVNPSGQGKAIQLATKSKYTHVGVIFIENGNEVVYHAVEPVMKSSLKEFVGMSADGKYEIKRLKNQSLLTTEVITKMIASAKSQLGLHYDLGFSWDDKEMYCSEYVWKIYNRALNISVGNLKALKEFDLSHPAVKEKLVERYGKNIPLDENMISPGDMYSSDLLE